VHNSAKLPDSILEAVSTVRAVVANAKPPMLFVCSGALSYNGPCGY
jgi:hypothetical protein